jgi:UDP-2,3-diacylglucosamine hydrolase
MIAIVAGTGTLPVEACKSLLNRPIEIQAAEPFFVIALFADNNLEQLQQVVQGKVEVISQECYKAGQVLDLLKLKKTTQILFIGKVDKSHLLKTFKFDWLTIKILASLLYKSDAAVMERIIKELASNGISVLRQDQVLNSLMVKPGILTGKLTENLATDVRMGIETAIKLSHFDIGQTVIVKDQMIMAVEAIEGTDKCITRGIELGKSNVVVCKAAHQNQNHKYDLPTLGPGSLENISQGEVAVIAWLHNKTFIAQQEEFIKKAKALGITLVSYKPEE